MRQIIKLMGVPARLIGPLHEVFESPTFHKRKGEGWQSSAGGGKVIGKIIKSSAKEGELYVVEIQLETDFFAIGQGKELRVFPSIDVLQAIYDVLGIYPKKERVEESEVSP